MTSKDRIENMKILTDQGIRSIQQQLYESSKIDGLPDRAFFKSFTPRRRREIVYHVTASAENIMIDLEVHGSGNMKASIKMPSVSIEDSEVHYNNEMHKLSWVHSGEEAIIKTRLDHKHLENYPCAQDVMKAFLDAIDTQKRAFCPGGFDQWKAMMQLFTKRVSIEHNVPVEIIATLPLPSAHTGALCRGETEVEINDISDPESPMRIQGYEDDIREMDEAATPEAMTLMLLPPGYLVCRKHREIFTAG